MAEIQHLKEQFDIDNEDEVQEITAARDPMKKNTAVYVTRNQTFAMKHGMKNCIHVKHTELW